MDVLPNIRPLTHHVRSDSVFAVEDISNQVDEAKLLGLIRVWVRRQQPFL
jgi:hypothetical protein